MGGPLRRLAVPLALAGVLTALPAVAASTVPVQASPVRAAGVQLTSSSPAADDGARVVDRRWIRSGREVELLVASPALGTRARVRLLLPRGWSPASARRWPTLWLLHGCCDSDGHTIWTRRTDVEQLVARRQVIVVMPSAGWAGFYSNWSNHGTGGAPRWQDFHLVELRQILERGFRAGSRRAVAGLSMGGFGALSYAARYPRMFTAAASFSGVVHTRMDWRGPALVSGLVLSGGSDPTALWGDPVLDAGTWAAHNPVDLADRLTGLPLYVSSGNGLPGPLDPAGALPDPLEAPIGDMNKVLVDHLRAEGAQLTARLYGPGTHTWPYWQRELHRAFPLLMGSLGA